MAAQDEDGINYLTELIQMKNPIEQVNFNEKENSRIDVATRTYYYDESDESKFEQKDIDGKTIFSLPTFRVHDEIIKQKGQAGKKPAAYDNTVLAKNAVIYFDAGKSDLKPQYNSALDAILNELQKSPDLGIEIRGFASVEGTEELNRELSNKRAIAVLDYINHKGIVRRRIVAKGYGATKDASASKEEGRRVEVQVIDLNQLEEKR
jgi:outer membrane protein OmpA-like peptidoglycan-associated protein